MANGGKQCKGRAVGWAGGGLRVTEGVRGVEAASVTSQECGIISGGLSRVLLSVP